METDTKTAAPAVEIQQPSDAPLPAVQSPTQVVASEDDSGFTAMITRMLENPQYDMERFKSLVTLRNEEMTRRAKLAFDADFVVMKPHLPLVIRSHDNTQTKSKYAKQEDINQQIDPILAQYGFGTSAKVRSQTDTHVTMDLELKHRGGYTEIMPLTMPIDDKGPQGAVNKTILHGISSTITYIKRVGFCAMLNVSTGDDKDGNTSAGDGLTISIEEAADLDKRARAIGEEYHQKFLDFMKVKGMTEIPLNQYKRAITQLTASEKEAERRRTATTKKDVKP